MTYTIEEFGAAPSSPKPAGYKIEEFAAQDGFKEGSASTVDVLKAGLTGAGLATAEGFGGGVRALGDMLRMDSVADWGAELARNARGAAEMATPTDMSYGQEILKGGVESAAMMMPFMRAAAVGRALPGIAYAAGQQFGETYSQLRDKDFAGGPAALHAGIRAAAEGIGEKISLPALSEGTRPLVNYIMNYAKKELVGEEFTTFVQMLDAKFAEQPNLTFGDFIEAAAATALTVPIAGTLQGGAARILAPRPPGAPGADGTPRGGEVPSPGQPPVAPAPTAGALPAGPAAPQPEVPATVVTPPTAPAPTEGALPEAVPPTTETPPAVVAAVPPAAPAPTEGALPPVAEIPPTQVLEPETPKPEYLPEPEPLPPPASPFPAPPDAFTQTPEEMATTRFVDPRLYLADEVLANQVSIRALPNGKFSMATLPHNLSKIEGSADEIIDSLIHGYGAGDLRQNPAALTKAYDAFILNEMMRDPSQVLDIGPAVEARFGGMLQEIASLSETKNWELYGSSEAPKRTTASAYFGELASRAGIGKPIGLSQYAVPVQRMGAGDRIELNTRADALALAPGIYQQPTAGSKEFNNNLRVVLRAMEALRAKYLPEHRVLLRFANDKEDHQFGSTLDLSDNIQGVTINRKTALKIASAKDQGKLLSIAAHEMGHAIMMHHFATADASTKAKLLLSYLQYTKELKRNTALRDFIIEHQADDRMEAPNATVEETMRSHPDWTQYVLSPSEYFADQAAQHLTKEVQHLDPEVNAWYAGLVERLKSIYDSLSALRGRDISFKENTTFTEWLNSLSGEPIKPVQGAKKPGPPEIKVDLTPVDKPLPTSVDSVEFMQKRKARLIDALMAAGATEEQMDAVEGNGTLAQFNWDAAYELADALGIPPSDYMKHYNTALVDDTTGLREGLNRLNQNLSDPDLRETIGGMSEAIKKFNWILQRTMTAVQLRKRYGARVPGVRTFVDGLERMWAYRSNWKGRADDRLKDMRKLAKDQRNRVFSVLLEEDKSGTFLSTVTQTPAGRAFILKPEVAQRFKLTNEGVALYAGIRADLDKALDEIQFNAEEELRRSYGNSPGGMQRLASMREDFDRMRAHPYVPHSRFGEHTVVVRDAKGKVKEFYQHEYAADAKRQENASRAELKNDPTKKGWSVSRGKISEEVRAFMGMPPQLLQAMKGQLKMDEQQIAIFEELIKDMSSGASFVRRFKRRNNTRGWESEPEAFPRAYADYMARFSNHASRIRFNPELNDGITQVRKQGRDFSKLGENTVELDDLANWLGRLQDYVNHPGEEYANIRAAATIWYLGFNVKSAAVNALSVPMVTVPYLSKRYGWNRSFAQVSQAYKDIGRKYARGQALTEDERLMLEDLREKGLIDASFASELAGIREGGRLADKSAGSMGAQAFFTTKQAAMWMFHRMEVVNREVTALAAYRMARVGKQPPGLFDTAAAKEAATVIQDTQNENAQWNRAEFMRNRKSLMFMFYSYQQNLMYQMLGGDSSWMRLLAVQLALAGLMGLPFAKDFSDLFKFFSRKVFDTDMDLDRAVRSYVREIGVNPEWVMRGFGHNILWSGLDIQGSISTGRVIPGVEALATEGDFANRIANAAGDVGGAAFSIIMDVLKAAASNDPDTIKRVSGMMPQAFRGLTEGSRAFMDGKVVDPTGALLAEVTPAEAAARTLGFQLTDVSTERTKRRAQKDVADYWLARRDYVLNIWGLAQRSGDSKWREQALKATQEYNAEIPDRNLMITGKQLRESMKRRDKVRARKEHGLGPGKTTEGVYRETGDLYGEQD